MFLGTPHSTSGLVHGAERLTRTISAVKQTNTEILPELRSELEGLAGVQNSFQAMIQARNQEGLSPIEITCFYEELPLPGIGIVSWPNTCNARVY